MHYSVSGAATDQWQRFNCV